MKQQPTRERSDEAMSIAMFVHILDDRAVSRVVGVLGHEIAARGVDIVVVCASSTDAGRARLPPELLVVDLGVDARHKTSRAVPALVRWLRRARPRVLFAHGEGPARAAVAARLLGRVETAVVIVQHTHGRTFRRASRARETAVRLLYPRAALVTGVAPAVVEDLEELVPALRGRTAVLPSVGPDPSELAARVAAQPGHPWFEGEARPFVIVSVANIVARKGQDVLVRALPAIRSAIGDARLLLIGRIDEPDFAAELRRMAADLGIADQVCLLGYREDPLPLVARSQLGALASKTEGLPMSLLEAMTCGLPVVSTDCPAGPAYLLEQGSSGLLVPVDDVDAMAEAVIRIARDDDLRAVLIARGRERAAAFSPAAVASRYLDVATQVAPPSRVGRRGRSRS
ncbi:MAG TPA: glycosyltransferase [Acidimicrobiia bacterium]